VQDTNTNAVDFVYVDTQGGGGVRLGAPGPENFSSPIQRNAQWTDVLLNTNVAASDPPNRLRDLTPGPPATSSLGTLTIRRRFINNTGNPVTRLRFRIIDVTVFPAAAGVADLRAISSIDATVPGADAATCAASGNTPPCVRVTVRGTTLETPPSQPNGGGYNSTLSSGTITVGTPLANGASINVQWVLGVKQAGRFRFFVNMESLP
jgi:hypothetical protein